MSSLILGAGVGTAVYFYCVNRRLRREKELLAELLQDSLQMIESIPGPVLREYCLRPWKTHPPTIRSN